MAHTHADGCPCKKHKKKTKVIRSRAVRHVPIMNRPMPFQSAAPVFSFAMPSLPAPHVHLSTNQMIKEVDSVAPGKVGVVGNKVQEQSHIETKAPETQHSFAVPTPKFSLETRVVGTQKPDYETRVVGTQKPEKSDVQTEPRKEIKTSDVQTEPVQLGKYTMEGMIEDIEKKGMYPIMTSGRKGTGKKDEVGETIVRMARGGKGAPPPPPMLIGDLNPLAGAGSSSFHSLADRDYTPVFEMEK